jgi:phage recombination protein Bet
MNDLTNQLKGSLAIMPAAPEVTSEQLDLIKNTVAKGATADELKLFFYDCARRGVHPLDKLLHFTKRGGKYTPVTSIDFMRSQAADSGEYAGNDDPTFLGDINDESLTATVTVYRMVQGQRCPFTATARWAEYKPAEAFMWNKMPFTMLGKCAEGLALRKAFPRQVAGLYSREEMDQSGKIEVLENIQADEAKADAREAEAMKQIQAQAFTPKVKPSSKATSFDPDGFEKLGDIAKRVPLPKPESKPWPRIQGGISELQHKRMFAVAREHGLNKQHLVDLLGRYSYEHSDVVTQMDYDSIIKDIESVVVK